MNLNHTDLAAALAERIVEGMDLDDLVAFATERLAEYYITLTPPQLVHEVTEFAPDLLEIL
jgi:hypothetical protein